MIHALLYQAVPSILSFPLGKVRMGAIPKDDALFVYYPHPDPPL
jgi:hypothetical protein